ncbi:MAG: RHS repeat-associated core domain-containing protein, partial [Planctomycetes bacterium]|nr:RHS repeat-associated core domain-containing protein [Planctomycetota bacterium]
MTTIPQPLAPSSSYTLKYDAWNRLVKVTDASDVSIQENEYDGLNRRIVKIDKAADPDVTYDYYYNRQWQVLEIHQDGDTVNPEKQYVYHPYYVDAIALRDYDADTNGSSVRHYYLQDANFNVTAVTDNTGAVAERYSYTPYGEVTFLDANFANPATSSTIGNEYLYTGRRLDPETHLQLNRNRFYASHLGRWVNRDPIGYDGSQWNLYEYGSSDPMTSVDPSGLGPKWWHCLKCIWKLNKIDTDEECNRRQMQEKCLECIETASECLEKVNEKTKECLQKLADAIPDCVKCAYK